MSGFYQNWVKVQNPNAVFPQMESEGFKKPFYFGGSQVPTQLHLNDKQYDGSGFNKVKKISMRKPATTANKQITGGNYSSRTMSTKYIPMVNK